MYDLCYIVSHGFVSRMLTQTDLLAKLRKKKHFMYFNDKKRSAT